MEDSVRLEQKGEAALLTLNRPEAYNAFDLDMIGLLAQTLIRLATDNGVTGVVITGAGRSFCAGGNLKWVSGYEGDIGGAFHALAAQYHQAVLEIRRMPKPVVAAVNGLAAGGGFSLALACDFRVVEAQAVFQQAYTSNGLSIDGGGTYALPRLVGLAKALEIAAFDRPISAEKALSWGLATEVVQKDESVKRALEMLGELQKRALSSFAASKKLLADSFDSALEAQLEKERNLLFQCANHPNGREGISAFLEKRKPSFNNIEKN